MSQVLFNFDFPETFVSRLQQTHPDLNLILCKDPHDAKRHLPRTEVLVTFFQCNREIIEAAEKLKWIQVISAGVDYLPLDLIAQRGILLTNGRGIHRIHMTEFAIASMINLARNFHLMFRNQLRRKWDRSAPQKEIYGSTLGILGLGDIGREIARQASAFGMRVIGVKRTAGPVDAVEAVYGPHEMDAVFRQSDYIINLLPYTSDTEQLIDRRYFDLMPETACFINIGRGKTVNEKDLVEALSAKKIRAMVSDVYYNEPLPESSPLWDLDNVILTPHVCGASPQYMQRAFEIIAHNLKVFASQQGRMINVVDLQTGY